jgi:hypothetical protein
VLLEFCNNGSTLAQVLSAFALASTPIPHSIHIIFPPKGLFLVNQGAFKEVSTTVLGLPIQNSLSE